MNEPLSESQIYRLLGNDRRRAVLRVLDEADEVTLDRLVDSLVDETSAEATHDGLARSVYVSLQQTHLPKLANCDVVEFDGGSGPIRRGPRFEQVRRHLRPDEDHWSRLVEVVSRPVAVLLLSVTCFVLGVVVGATLIF
jgi:DNA-binding transcriptional ArsR family regulator